MSNRPKSPKKPEQKPAGLAAAEARAHQFNQQRRQDFNTRSILSRLRNRKSDLK